MANHGEPGPIALFYAKLTTAGGAERQFLEEYRHFRRRGMDVRAITFDLGEARAFLDPLELERVLVLNGRSLLAKVVALRSALAAMRARLLVAHTSFEMASLAALGSGVPYVIYHNSPPFYLGYPENPVPHSWRYRGAFRRAVETAPGYREFALPAPCLTVGQRVAVEIRAACRQFALRHARAIVVLSDRARRELKQLYSITATVQRGCLPDVFPQREAVADVRATCGIGDRPLVLSICRLHRIKRVDMAIRAMGKVVQAVPDVHLVIGGIGPDEKRLRDLVRSLGLGAAVHFVGFVEDNAIWDYYRACDVFVAPATADFNIAPYEALAAGRKVVVSSELELETHLRQSDALFLAEPTDEAFATQIVRALTSRPIQTPDLTELTWTRRAERIELLFENIIANPASPQGGQVSGASAADGR